MAHPYIITNRGEQTGSREFRPLTWLARSSSTWRSPLANPVEFFSFRKTMGDFGSLTISRPCTPDKPIILHEVRHVKWVQYDLMMKPCFWVVHNWKRTTFMERCYVLSQLGDKIRIFFKNINGGDCSTRQIRRQRSREHVTGATETLPVKNYKAIREKPEILLCSNLF